MASPRVKSVEGQDGSVNPRTPRQLKQSVFEFPNEHNESHRNRFRVTRLGSENQQNPARMETVNSLKIGGENILHRSVSSMDFKQYREHPPLKRTVSSISKTFSTTSKSTYLPKAEIIKRNVKSQNGNMVLQLVLPNNNPVDNGNYLTSTSLDEILSATSNRRRSIGSQQDLYSTTGTECFVNQAYTNDLGDYGRNLAQSPISNVSSSDHPKSTTTEDKMHFFRKYLANILSSMYAVFIVTLGLVVYISDVIVGNSPMSETFSLYLVVVAFVFILYLTIDIKRYMNKKNRYDDLLEKNITEDIEVKESPGGDFYHLNIQLPEAIKVRKLEHHYCYNKDRHSANFYLKVGAAGFCIGHLIHSGLLLGYQILFLTSDGDAFYECASVASLILDIIYPIYSFLLLYFIFKYSNVVINRHVMVSRFGMMHCLASSLCFWVWTILRETIESLAHHDNDDKTTEATSTDTSVSEITFLTGQPIAEPLTSYEKIGAKRLTNFLNASLHQFVGECKTDQGLSMIYRNYSPYLYPFTVEYSILVVGVLFVIWQSIGKCKEKEEMSSTLQCESPVGNNDNHESNIVIHVDCHSANKGLFCGIVVMVLTAVSVILFLVAVNDSRFENGAVIINYSTSIFILCFMVLASIFAYRQITKLDLNLGHASLLDNLLLFICIPAFFLDCILSFVTAVVSINGLSIAFTIIQIIQVLVQTPLIIDGLRRCSNSKCLRKEKPGRELLTFLIVCNLALWLMQTFEVKSHGDQGDFYGEELYSIITHLCVPLMMFYRFHSSVCIVDIWKYAYEPSNH